jgi:hypothetical protein
VANADQKDADGDGMGDACNDDTDADGDEWADDLDNCPGLANPGQEDLDHDGLGDACDPYPANPDNYAARCDEAIDNESSLQASLNACLVRPGFVDTDGDGEEDRTDACPNTPAGLAVDAQGCSVNEFCERQSGQWFYSTYVICVASDWQNDEPLEIRPRDCKPDIAFSPTGGVQVSCRAAQ